MKKEYIKNIPRLAKEYDAKANEVPIDDITTGSGITVNWVCEKGHKWGTTAYNRAKKGYNCPYCAGNLPIKGENDLATVYPDVARDWHYIKNGDLRPENFKPQSSKKMWWLCPKGHEYEAFIFARTRGRGCPYCSGRYVVKGETDLEHLRPDIANDWHPTKNGDIKPDTIPVGTNSKFWWLCPRGHEYEMKVSARTRKIKAQSCPYCSGKKPIIGETDLGTVCKEANQFWDYDKNDTVPSDYLPYSETKIWLKCDNGHSWNNCIKDFTRTPKCPYCSGTIVEKDVNTLRARYPHIAEKWHYEKNVNINIDTVHVGSVIKKYWWKCEKGHEFIKDVAGMVRSKGKGCPYCSGHISKYSI